MESVSAQAKSLAVDSLASKTTRSPAWAVAGALMVAAGAAGTAGTDTAARSAARNLSNAKKTTMLKATPASTVAIDSNLDFIGFLGDRWKQATRVDRNP